MTQKQELGGYVVMVMMALIYLGFVIGPWFTSGMGIGHKIAGTLITLAVPVGFYIATEKQEMGYGLGIAAVIGVTIGLCVSHGYLFG